MKCDVLLPSQVAVNVFVLSDVIIPLKDISFSQLDFGVGTTMTQSEGEI